MSPIILVILLAILAGIAFSTWKAPRLTGAILWSFLASISVIIAVINVLPGPAFDRVMSGILFAPLVWVAFQFWCYWERKKWRVTAAMMSVTALSVAAITVF